MKYMTSGEGEMFREICWGGLLLAISPAEAYWRIGCRLLNFQGLTGLRSNTQCSNRQQSTRSNSPFSDREPAKRTHFLASAGNGIVLGSLRLSHVYESLEISHKGEDW